MDSRVKLLVDQGDKLFSKRASLVSLWQEQAELFYPERADFTVTRNVGQDFASNLTTSIPLLARRELGGTMGGMLRPGKNWAKVSVVREDLLDLSARRWLDHATDIQRRVMYDRAAMLGRATSETDHDFITFGQGVLSASLNRNADGIIHRNHHLRDIVWVENEEGKPDRFQRKWNAEARTIKRLFPKTLSAKVSEAAEKDPFKEFECRHDIIPSDQYEGAKKTNAPFWSVFYEVESGTILEETPYWNTYYVVPRFQTVSGSQYAFSPATIAAMPDSRLIQDMTLTILEAGQKAVNPPMVGVKDVIKSDVGMYAGSVTWVDKDYDERLGEALRPVRQDASGLAVGFSLRSDVRQTIADAFFLNKIQLPPLPAGTTAYEAAQRVAEYVRQALPLFDPIQQDYNGQLCEIDFDLIMRNGGFGSPDEIPDALRGQDVQFVFDNALSDAQNDEKRQKYLKSRELLATVAPEDPAARIVDNKKALRDVLEGSVPADWIVSEEDMAAMEEQGQAAAAQAQLMQTVGQGAAVTEQLGKANQALAA